MLGHLSFENYIKKELLNLYNKLVISYGQVIYIY